MVSRARFWKELTAALLTTQQRSGPRSAVAKLMNARPFPLGYELSCKEARAKTFFKAVLFRHGGIWRHSKIAIELAANLRTLNDGRFWLTMREGLENLRAPHARGDEIALAEFIADELAGFGSKQSRNLLQSLGLTRYEIPIDSRIIKWLNGIGFPFRLSGKGLGDRA